MKDDDLLREMWEGRVDPASLDKRMSLDELVAWLGDPRVRARIAAMCEIGELQARLVTSRYRCTVATRLMSLATDDAMTPETARRAAVDVLKLQLMDRASTPLAVPRQSAAAALREVMQDQPVDDADQAGAQ